MGILSGNYVYRYRTDEGGNGEAPRIESNKESGPHGDSPRALLDCMRLAGDKDSNAGGPRSIARTPKSPGSFGEPIARDLKESDTDDDRRSSGIAHGRKVAAGLGDSPEVADYGFLHGFARSLKSIAKELKDTLSSLHTNWSDGARKVAPGVYLTRQVRCLEVVDLVHFLHIDVGVYSIHPRWRYTLF